MIYPVFSMMPDFTTAPAYALTTLHERAGLSPAQDTVFFPQAQADLAMSFAFTFFTRYDVRALKAFFLGRGGRAMPFYMPSWRADLPAVSGTSGTNLLTIIAPGYQDAHFGTGTHADDKGRQIFVWQPGQDLFTSAVVAGTEGLHGHVELNMVKFLPFTIDPATVIIGFLHLARFEDDELNLTHMTSDVASVSIKFRCLRAWNGEENDFTLTPADHGNYKGFATAAQRAGDSMITDERVAYALGPMTLGTPEPMPYAIRYAAWVNSDGIRIAQQSGAQTIPDSGGDLTTLTSGFVDTDHISLCFEANGHEVIAYQRTATGIRLMRRLIGGPTHYDFAGLDPVLVFNGQLDLTLEGEDTGFVCYYRKAGENKLFARASDDLFATEWEAAVLPAKPLRLKASGQGGQSATVEFLDTGMRRVTLTSSPYPM